ncbi:MAG: methyltransferase domain-containing protein [Chloroflexi bacterium]|nr:methyltransferase domain-containing protein [Chloroflexota bacterium]
MPLLFHFIFSLYTFLYRQLYTRFAWAYDSVSWLVSLGRWDGWRRVALGFVTDVDVLEVGFGTGELLSELARQQIAVTGLEASAAMHGITTRKLSRRGQKACQVQGLAQQLPFTGAAFDTIISTFPAGFATDPAAHREFARVLRPGGRLVIVDVALSTDNPVVRLFFNLAFPPKPGVDARFQQALDDSGLRISRRLVGAGPVRVVVTLGEKAASDAHSD